MATTAISKRVATAADESSLPHPGYVNIRPILESVAGKLTEDEIDQWFVGLHEANEGRGFHLDLTADGKLIINPVVSRKGSASEFEHGIDLGIWTRENNGEAHGANFNMRLPDGSRVSVPMPCGYRRSK